ncbi:hypothetical protein N9L92_04280, partial [Saprospiraceae bacterium]|nr:hypothetical protein [Saprospiraceae bacterium]
SGKVNMRYDASEMVAMAEMMKGMEEDVEEEEMEEDMDDGDIMSMLDGLGNPSNLQDVDSTFTFYEVMPDSIKSTIKNPELLKNVSVTINTNKSEMTAVMGMEVRYKSLDELDEIFLTLKEMGDEKDEENSQMESVKELIRNYEADLKNGIVTLPEQDFSGDLAGDGMGDENIDFENMSDEESGMMAMMIGESGYVTTIHLPGEVISCDDTEAIIEGNTVTIKDSYMTLMKEGIFKARTIKYKVK